MTQIDRRPSHGATANGNRARGTDFRSTRKARAKRVYDGVVASYIRDISMRTAQRT